MWINEIRRVRVARHRRLRRGLANAEARSVGIMPFDFQIIISLRGFESHHETLPRLIQINAIPPGFREVTETSEGYAPMRKLALSAAPVDYLRAAQSALQAARTGEAQRSLEMAKTRLPDRSVSMGQTNNPSDNPAVRQISQALQALADGDIAQFLHLIRSAIPFASASAS